MMTAANHPAARLTSEIDLEGVRRAESEGRRQFVASILERRRAVRVTAIVAFTSAVAGAVATVAIGL